MVVASGWRSRIGPYLPGSLARRCRFRSGLGCAGGVPVPEPRSARWRLARMCAAPEGTGPAQVARGRRRRFAESVRAGGLMGRLSLRLSSLVRRGSSPPARACGPGRQTSARARPPCWPEPFPPSARQCQTLPSTRGRGNISGSCVSRVLSGERFPRLEGHTRAPPSPADATRRICGRGRRLTGSRRQGIYFFV